MTRVESRYERLFRKTHRFVPKRILHSIYEYEKRQLEIIPKREDLKRRVAEFSELYDRVVSVNDPEAKAELNKLWWEDEEARLTYFVQLRDGLPEVPGSGLWFENSTAANIFQKAKDSKIGLERLERERKKREED